MSASTTAPGFFQASTAPALSLAAQVGGYAWWYAEVHDAQGRFGLTLIVFAGSVFSAEYAARLRSGEAVTGLDVPAVNLAIYERTSPTDRPRQKLWVMNEYPKSSLHTSDHSIQIEHTRIVTEPDGSLRIDLSEPSTRFFGKPGPRLSGQLRFGPPPRVQLPVLLGESPSHNAHFWQPLSLFSSATVELRLENEPISFPAPRTAITTLARDDSKTAFCAGAGHTAFPTMVPSVLWSMTRRCSTVRAIALACFCTKTPPSPRSFAAASRPRLSLRWMAKTSCGSRFRAPCPQARCWHAESVAVRCWMRRFTHALAWSYPTKSACPASSSEASVNTWI